MSEYKNNFVQKVHLARNPFAKSYFNIFSRVNFIHPCLFIFGENSKRADHKSSNPKICVAQSHGGKRTKRAFIIAQNRLDL